LCGETVQPEVHKAKPKAYAGSMTPAGRLRFLL
jgi:hypothetical protein